MQDVGLRIGMAKAAFNKEKALSTGKLDLNFRTELFRFYIWDTALYGANRLEPTERRPEIPGKFVNVILEKNGEDKLGRSREK
jgi:hypothetical protein